MARKSDKRGYRDQAGVGPEPGEARHLTPMKELKKFRFADGEPDIRGWRVFSSSGSDLGKVEDLLVDTTRSEVVMVDIAAHDSDRRSLAPLREAWVDRETKRVVLDKEAVPAASRAAPDVVRAPVEREHGELADLRYQQRDETVVRSRPVIVEETVLRRRTVEGSEPGGEEAEPGRSDTGTAERRPEERP